MHPTNGSEVRCVQLDSRSTLLNHFNTSYIWSVQLVRCLVKSDLKKCGSILFNRMIPPLLQWDKRTVWHPCSWQLWDDAHKSAPRRWTVHPASMLTVSIYQKKWIKNGQINSFMLSKSQRGIKLGSPWKLSNTYADGRVSSCLRHGLKRIRAIANTAR